MTMQSQRCVLVPSHPEMTLELAEAILGTGLVATGEEIDHYKRLALERWRAAVALLTTCEKSEP